MTEPWLLFDLLLVAAMLGLAWASLAARERFTTIVLFIVFGLVVALAWVRLRAPDVALAEAAVGAGVTGALFLSTWRRLERRPEPKPEPEPKAAPGRGGLAVLALTAVVAATLGAALLGLPRPGPRLGGLVAESLPRSGVENPVTAVLLNFRAYDTLLEVVVLLAAAMVVWLRDEAPAPSGATLGPVFEGFARLALPVMVVVAAYLLWLGAFAPGGAFQGGAVLAAVGIVLILGRLHAPGAAWLPWARLALGLGTAAFVAAALLALALGGDLLQYPEASAKTWILVIESALTLSIAATLAALVHGGAPSGGAR